MEGIYPVIIGGKVCGKLRVEKEGGYTLFRAECPMTGEVIRLSVYGDGKEGYLGVPLPRDGMLRLEKKLSPAAMRDFPGEIDHCGLAGEKAEEDVPEEPEAGGEEDGDEGGPLWYATTDGALVSRSEGMEMVALPPEDSRVPRDIPGQPRTIEGKEYLVYITKEM